MQVHLSRGSDAGAADTYGRVRSAHTFDIDEQAALLRGWNQTYDQMSRGLFSGSLAETDLGRIRLFREVTGNSLHQNGYLPKGLFAVGIPISMTGNATFCGANCDGRQLHIFSGRSGFEFHSPQGLDIVGLVLSEEVLYEVLSEKDAGAVMSDGEAHLRSTSIRCGRQLRDITVSIFEALAQGDCKSDRARWFESMSRDVVSALADAMTGDVTEHGLRIPQDRRWQIVRRACEFARSSTDNHMTIEQICASLGISRRALQYCFQDTLGLAPAAYLKAVRLNGARRSLKACNTVTEAAALWGFWHFGRFAKDYNVMFGELPSATFRRFHSS